MISFAVRVRPLDSAVIADGGDLRPRAVILPRMAKTPELARNQRVTGTERTKLGNELLKRYQKGASIREICAETGYSIGRVRRLLVDAGVEFRGRGGTQGRSRKDGKDSA
jgi:hypothetical protein